ncbi:mitotic checkpoint serine/threonine-protein kinase BUB1 isoform X1 [Scleropages formosus]|uniref:mitotic checkpoint serine/threonine-protein kinase BUB1 isoform X1 n=1 Tax=Scleropages formosus TaxID=113540 RepID=UPI0010FA85D6|nr:mitotic checkpoint serine/threonine-protein kinase BUB1 isoform X1 [Scleropages formosus]
MEGSETKGYTSPERFRNTAAEKATGDLEALLSYSLIHCHQHMKLHGLFFPIIIIFMPCRKFEMSLSTYTGDDPLDLWERYVEHLEKEQNSCISSVLNRLVQTFLPQKRYCNDIRYINLCIKCASYYSDPINLYSYIHGEGIGARTSPLYVAWAQEFEKRGLFPQADAVYQRALENQAEPSEMILQQYRLFKARPSEHQNVAPGAVRNPLQNSQVTNQMEQQRERLFPQFKDPEGWAQVPTDRTLRIISRSENTPVTQPGQASSVTLQSVSMYCVNDLVCEGSEMCFEELRAQRYFEKCRQQKTLREWEEKQRCLKEEEEEVRQLKSCLVELESILNANKTEEQQDACTLKDGSLNKSSSRLHPEPYQQPNGHRSVSSGGSTLVQNLNAGLPPGSLPRAHLLPHGQSFQCSTLDTLGPHTLVQPVLAGSEKDEAAAVFGHCLSQPSQLSKMMPSLQGPPVTLSGPVLGSFTSASLVDQSTNISCCSTASLEITGLKRAACAVQSESGGFHTTNINNHSTSKFDQQSFRGELDPSGNTVMEINGTQDVSEGGTENLSHITPNTSLGLVQATPCRVQPSPTVNTREALDVIMDMFQAPTLIQDESLRCMSRKLPDNTSDITYQHTVIQPSGTGRAPTAVPFSIFQDENEKENAGVNPRLGATRPARILADLPVSKQVKQNDTSASVKSSTDDSTVWGPHCNNNLATCPNNTGDFAVAACLVSTPFHATTTQPWKLDEDQENHLQRVFSDSKTFQHQSTKLSPILEQSSFEEKGPLSSTAMCSDQGTIFDHHMLPASSISEQSERSKTLSFPEQMLSPDNSASSGILAQKCQKDWDVGVSPDLAPKLDIFHVKSPEHDAEPDWVSLKSVEHEIMSDVSPPKSPGDAPKSNWFLSKSPEQVSISDFVLPKSPEQATRPDFDIPMSPDPEARPVQDVPSLKTMMLISDPWDEDLISRLLARLPTPLSCTPNFSTWNCKVPSIVPKTTVTIGTESFRVDCVLGEGAFATVYQARCLATSEKLIFKVQKPPNPWEFYINSQLNQRLPSSLRHLFNNLYSAHLFQNGSVLLGELHNCGTLLNVVNLYKNTCEKVMAPPLAMYFAVCILQMVEHLHSSQIIHADIKPDNFIFGERFLENECFDPDHLDHGLALIDLGQSIDMTLFPEGTAFTAKCMTSGFQCTEMLSGRPWNYQTDYFGIAGTVYCMIFGTYMKVKNEDGVWKTNAVFKRNPHAELWMEFFHTLLNVPDCTSLPCLRILRSRLSAELQQNYGTKLRMLKKRLVGQLLESKRSCK